MSHLFAVAQQNSHFHEIITPLMLNPADNFLPR